MNVVINESLIISKDYIKGNLIITLNEDVKYCKSCSSFKSQTNFYSKMKVCKICYKDGRNKSKVNRIKQECLVILNKIRPGVMINIVGKIQLALTSDKITYSKVLEIRKKLEKIYFDQQVNDEIINNIIKG